MIFLFILQATSWQFASYDELNAQCSICQYFTKKLSEDIHYFDGKLNPEAGSECSKNKTNKICLVINAISSNFIHATNKTDYCRRVNFCPAEVPEGYSGPRCRICMRLVSHLLIHKNEDRKTAFYNFCVTSKSKPANFCGDVIDEGVEDFLYDVDDVNDSFKFCHLSHYCRDSANVKSKLFQSDEEL
ncbi:hypothetical protein TRFO_24658 [Tritrichomonas foetus]|uniref:Saposin B-type domain-containing protein n=1 Tax=Tritrichomonas foetus TaxID=1144522 RepID=A0A1J4K8F3_9EUKA|nr:hypothetical protein TRFO_24658 [Tritrichomonas foetus]|eukprot:OHT07250.1 hypothetical protein TRFO_24658 [Tritrichomonas foetus]